MNILKVGLALACLIAGLNFTQAERLPEFKDIKVEPFKTTKTKKDSNAKKISWGAARLNVSKAQAITKGNIDVCVVDTGIDSKNASLGVIGGRNFAGGSHFDDTIGNGTEIAGVITSVAPAAKLYAAKIVDDSGQVPYELSPQAMAQAILSCADQGFKLINISVALNKAPKDNILDRAVYLASRKGSLVIAAAGLNAEDHGVGYPARYSGAVAVAASDPSDHPIKTIGVSISGEEIQFIAPGKDIVTVEPGGMHTSVSGTGLAAAYVTGLAALYWSLPEHSNDSPEEVLSALRKAARAIPGLPRQIQGHGMIDAQRLIEQQAK